MEFQRHHEQHLFFYTPNRIVVHNMLFITIQLTVVIKKTVLKNCGHSEVAYFKFKNCLDFSVRALFLNGLVLFQNLILRD